MASKVSKDEVYRCGHCLYPIAKMKVVNGRKLLCPSCGVETTYEEAAIPHAVGIPEGHICEHATHEEKNPLLKMLLVGPYDPNRKRRRSSMD
jgi:DNA-directed RNA polymerase subunit RPC12/RpoP